MSEMNDMGFIENTGFTSMDVGEYDAVIHGVIGLGLHPVADYKGKKKQPNVFVRVIFEIPSLLRDDKSTTTIGKRIKLGIHENSKCYEFLSDVYGKSFNKTEVGSYIDSAGLKQLLGKTVTVTISTFEKEGKNITYVEKAARLDPRLPQPVSTRELFLFNPLNPDIEVFKKILTYKTQEDVMNALNSDNYPKELHEAWVAIQEDKASDNKSAPFNTAGLNTEAIE